VENNEEELKNVKDKNIEENNIVASFVTVNTKLDEFQTSSNTYLICSSTLFLGNLVNVQQKKN
jgi:hypothetical protein